MNLINEDIYITFITMPIERMTTGYVVSGAQKYRMAECREREEFLVKVGAGSLLCRGKCGTSRMGAGVVGVE